MRQRRESADSALRYFNKLVNLYVGRGFSYEAAVQTAVGALAKRYEGFGQMMVGHTIVKKLMEKYGINSVASAIYFSFVNAYLKQIRLGHPDEAKAVIKTWKDKGANPKLIDEIVDWLGSAEAESPSETS